MKLPFFLAKRFVAGESFKESIPKAKQLNNKDLKLTLDLLGENVKDRQTATDTVDAYIRLLEGIKEHGLISSISIKLTMMGLDIDHDFCQENLFRLLDVAKEQNQFVRIDMEGSDCTQITLDIFKEAFQKYGKHVGTVIQSMLFRSKDDINELAEMGADIRLVKGAYKEPAKIALQDMPAIREAFKEQAKVLLEKTEFPRFGTHDDELIDWLKRYTADKNIPKDRFEFQMLYGLREETMVQLTDEEYCTRVYVPFGTDWFPYFTRRLMERKENIWFIFSTMFKK
ncbi:MAG: proline dehydrogenase family protein [Gracilimonas sp.]|uniref:proline dehydrogenase family protein n=1 Tax=Gracilimonas sp. TaxID=1974203 RepID=UPI0019A402B2|nr:proline dehydrogenase family protein [Gracilimonas sp.]MBD3617146.1 proline dehydrogenase family protein [Gracilimonas sp.]